MTSMTRVTTLEISLARPPSHVARRTGGTKHLRVSMASTFDRKPLWLAASRLRGTCDAGRATQDKRLLALDV